jgi:hypothetical protein
MRYFRIENCSGVIRLEHLEEDVQQKIVPLLPPQTPPLNFPKDNVNHYSRDLTDYFRSSDIRRIYCNNPIWKQQEQEAYGRILMTRSMPLAQKIRGLFQ